MAGKGNTLFKYKSTKKQTVDLKVGLALGEDFEKVGGDWVVRLMTKYDKFLTLPKEYTGSKLAIPAVLRLPGKWRPFIDPQGVKGLLKTSSASGLTKVMVGDIFELTLNPPSSAPLTEQESENMSIMRKRTVNTFSFDRLRVGKEPNALGSIMSIFNFVIDPFELGKELWFMMSHSTNNKIELTSYLKQFPSETLVGCLL